MVRRGLPADVRFLRDMLHHAYYWRERAAGSVTARYVKGFGDELLVALCRRARAESHPRLSLSVDPANPALKLYEQHGSRRSPRPATGRGSWRRG